MAQEVKKVPLFQELETQLDLDTLETSELESVCMECYKNGVTRLLLTKIPMFREVIVSSFHCEHCGNSNSEVQSGASIQDQGVKFKLKVTKAESLSLMMVKSELALFCIPELEFEIPAGTQKGQVTTVDSILLRSVENLQKDQPYRMETAPEVAKKVDDFIARLKDCLSLKTSFTVVLDDPSGNSFIEKKFGELGEELSVEHYDRTKEQDVVVGVTSEDNTDSAVVQPSLKGEDALTTSLLSDDVMAFHDNCPNCQSPVEIRMKMVDIPHFKQVVIMATNCEYCGYKSNEVKPGAGIEERGVKHCLRITSAADLTRDLLKSDTASLRIPELEFDIQCGTIGGCFTTVEGLMVQARDQLKDAYPFSEGDSAEDGQRSKMHEFLGRLNEVIEGKRLNVHIVLDDPAGNSYIQNFNAPDPDPELTVEHYERTAEHNEELGLDHMNTENTTS